MQQELARRTSVEKLNCRGNGRNKMRVADRLQPNASNSGRKDLNPANSNLTPEPLDCRATAARNAGIRLRSLKESKLPNK